jgi:hypothetical protein
MSTLKLPLRDVRLSLAWTRCHLDIVLDPQARSRLNFLGRRVSYETAFGGAATPGPANQGLGRPWVIPPGQPFWSHYLEGTSLDRVSPNQAWRALVPFRRRLDVHIELPKWPVRVVPHGFFYPHGVGLVLDITMKGEATLEATIDRSMAFMNGEPLDLTRPRSGRQSVALPVAASTIMDALSSEFLDREYTDNKALSAPFSVFTVVSGGADTPVAGPATDPEVHKALDGLVSWNHQWRVTSPASLADSALPLGRAPAEHALYGATRGRAVWFPYDFTIGTPPQRTLGTFHRDLVLTSLQIESLVGFMQATTDYLAAGNPRLQAVHGDCARPIAGLLGRLYGQAKNFPSPSPRYQIKQNNYEPTIDQVRGYFNLPPLHYP